jgi:hypothetical protein
MRGFFISIKSRLYYWVTKKKPIFDYKPKNQNMIKKLLSAVLVTVTISINAQQVQNPGFETWASSLPVSWGTFDEMLVNLGQSNPGTATQTATKHSGSSAVLLQNQFVALKGANVQGIVCTGPVTFVGGKPSLGFQAYTGGVQPGSYDFWYQFNAMGGDTASTQVYLTKWNTGNNKRDTLAYGGSYIIGVASVYTHTTVAINWFITAIPDSIQLLFSSSIQKSTASPPTGGQLYIDDVNMNLSSGIQTVTGNSFFSTAYPNPAVNSITISSNLKEAKYAKVFDVTGRLVNSYEINNKLTSVDLSSYENGMYIYVITDERNNRLHTSKFNVVK